MMALVGAALFAPSPTPAGAQNVCPEPANPVDPEDPRIVVTSPEPGDEITSPVTVVGEAEVFEANVLITIFDAEGNALVETFTTALGAGPEMWPFESDPIPFDVDETQEGCIWVFEEAADETLDPLVLAIPVTLVAPEPGQFSPEPVVGLTITQYTGTLEQLEADGAALNLVSCFATVGGQLVGYVFGAPAFVNATFVAEFEAGLDGQGLICRRAA